MSQPNSLSVVANLLRPVSKDVSKGNGKLCLSTVYLNKLNKAFDENLPGDLTSSFHLTEAKASLQIDLQFLLDLVKGTVALKVSPDLIEDDSSKIVHLRRFENVKNLEIHKIDVKNIIGIQKLRSHIEELTCTYNLDNLVDILDKCGGDLSHQYNWIELKRVNFSHNRIQDIDASFESTPSLQVLDLSHNLIRNLEFIDHLPNLKRLNLSYNKLEKVPKFKGQICKRLQILLLNNNFIEDISGLTTLSDLHQLDLAQNCLMDHNSLLSISHMSSLYSLDLRGNPINFHPVHRTLTCNYLNKNTATLNFILDNIPLTKTEKSLSGSLYPISQSSLGLNENYSSQNSLDNSVQERQRKVRNVTIQEGYAIKIVERKKSDVVIPSPRSNDRTHLDVKNMMEQIHEEYGEKWLPQISGDILKGVLKFPEIPKPPDSTSSEKETTPLPVEREEAESLISAPEVAANENQIVNNTVDNNVESNVEVDDDLKDADDVYGDTKVSEETVVEAPSDEEDLDDKGIFMGSTVQDSYDLCIVVTDKWLSERDSETTKKKNRWHLSIVKSCQRGTEPNEVKLEFDTLQSDRVSRTYYMGNADEFVKLVFEGMVKNRVPENRVQYWCLSCNYAFCRTKITSSVFDEEVICPQCNNSKQVIESK